MAIFFSCFLVVFLSEMGDKTQWMVLVLSTRFKRPLAILAGVLVASLANFGLVAWLGKALSAHINPLVLRYCIALSFLGFAVWLLFPENEEGGRDADGKSAFWTTVASIFLAEMGDKGQFAVLALSARLSAPLLVTLGSSLGMVAADSLAIVFGERLKVWVPMHWVRRAASLLFAIFGVGILLWG